jgi:hypothetical protein
MPRADHDNRSICVETETERDVGFYERLGFEVLEEMTVTEIGLSFSFMIRPPRTRHP